MHDSAENEYQYAGDPEGESGRRDNLHEAVSEDAITDGADGDGEDDIYLQGIVKQSYSVREEEEQNQAEDIRGVYGTLDSKGREGKRYGKPIQNRLPGGVIDIGQDGGLQGDSCDEEHFTKAYGRMKHDDTPEQGDKDD
jgi:hypothetical protein